MGLRPVKTVWFYLETFCLFCIQLQSADERWSNDSSNVRLEEEHKVKLCHTARNRFVQITVVRAAVDEPELVRHRNVGCSTEGCIQWVCLVVMTGPLWCSYSQHWRQSNVKSCSYL